MGRHRCEQISADIVQPPPPESCCWSNQQVRHCPESFLAQPSSTDLS